MINGVLHYILQEFPPAKLSEIYYQKSANNVAAYNYNQEGARYIWYQTIYWTPQNSGNVIEFQDQYQRSLFQIVDLFTLTNWAPIQLIRKGQQMRIQAKNIAGAREITLQFFVSFQYVISDDNPIEIK